ncbi:LPD29 domain-containing protein [Clostridioides sp. ZZV15-6597]|uniref:LPD29 domain-containing protein n=1 Tax=Clostridioides sp. ZZV15-6597 TaxID=2811500 RepID=UPI001D121777|nr:hypothetical protein [Clostridioides sp. ZZV15-6597]
MDYFKDIKSLEELKSTFKKLAKIHHPDMGGNDEVMKKINNEYECLFPTWKKKSKIITTETANSTRCEFYTEYGWKGEHYSDYLSIKDIAKIIRQYVKEIYPIYKFSITTSDGMCSTINVSLMEAPQNIFNEGCEKDYLQISYYNIDRNEKLNEIGKSILSDVYNLLKEYNLDDSDAMIDYFDTNFYMYFNIGKWDKPFKIVKKINRIKNSVQSEKLAMKSTLISKCL